MNTRAAKMNAARACGFPLDGEHFTSQRKTDVAPVRISEHKPLREIIMFRPTSRTARLAIAACAMLLPDGSALASQGPGGGMGTAGSLTQTLMAVIVYGASALVIGTGLIGALRRR
jgi:hypothetical protein